MMETRKLHIYTDTKLLQANVAKEFDGEKTETRSDEGHLILSGCINMHSLAFSVDVVATETFRQFTMHETERKSPDSIMVFLTKDEDKEEKDGDSEALVMFRGMKEVISFDSLKKLWTNIANMIQQSSTVKANSAEEFDDTEMYKMNSSPRGFCMIINNRDFEARGDDNNELALRNGTDVDAKNLHNIFESLNFKVETLNNLTDSGIIREVKKMSLVDHSDFDAFVCCILSHGRHGSILGVNNKEVPIVEITSNFRIRGCPSLAEKPKLFFIQACQGQRPQRGVDSTVERDVFPDEETKCVLPDGSDFLVACSSEPGFESFRHKDKGSFFINSLVKNLKASRCKGLLDILTDVCNDMCKETFDQNLKQVSWLTSTLTKKVVFKQ